MNEEVTRLGDLLAPYGRQIIAEDVAYDNGMHVLRLRIREEKRFTIMDINPETARAWAEIMTGWADQMDRIEESAD